MLKKYPLMAVILLSALMCRCAPPGANGGGGGGNQEPPKATGVIVTTELPNATEEVLYTGGTLQASVTPGALIQWNVDVETLPAGLSLDPSTVNSPLARIQGTPELGSGGEYNITVALMVNGDFADLRTDVKLTVIDQLRVTPSKLYSAQPGMPYSVEFKVTGGSDPYTWEIEGVPDWLGVFQLGDIILLVAGANGVPIEEFGESYTIVVKVKDSSSPKLKGGRTYTLNVTYPDEPLSIAEYLWPAVPDHYYNQRVAVSGGVFPYTYKFLSFSQPTWLNFDESNGTVYGTPDSSLFDSDSVVEFEVEVTDSADTPTTLMKTVQVHLFSDLTIETENADLPVLKEGEEVNFFFEYGTSPAGLHAFGLAAALGLQLGWFIDEGNLPILLALDGHLGGSQSGVLEGMVVPYGTAGTYPFTIKLIDWLSPGREVYKDFTLTIERGDLIVVSDTLPDARAFMPYEQTLLAGGGEQARIWSLDPTAPGWLSIDAATGKMSGIPDVTDIGPQTVTVYVNDGVTEAFAPLALTVGDPSPLVIDSSSLQLDAVKDQPWWGVLSASGGAGDYSWSLVPVASGDLPGTFTVDADKGWIRGTPDTVGSFPFTVKVTDRIGTEKLAPHTLVVSTTAAPGLLVGGPVKGEYNFDDMANGIKNDRTGKWIIGDGGPAFAATLMRISAFDFDSDGNLYIADNFHYAIRKVSVSTGGVLSKYSEVTTICGGNTEFGGAKGAGGPAIDAQLDNIMALVVDGADNLYACEMLSGRILRIDLKVANPNLEVVTKAPHQMPFASIAVNNRAAKVAATRLYVASLVSVYANGGLAEIDLASGNALNIYSPPDYSAIHGVGISPSGVIHAITVSYDAGSTYPHIPYTVWRLNTTSGSFEKLTPSDEGTSHVGFPGYSLPFKADGTYTKLFNDPYEMWGAYDASGRFLTTYMDHGIEWK